MRINFLHCQIPQKTFFITKNSPICFLKTSNSEKTAMNFTQKHLNNAKIASEFRINLTKMHKKNPINVVRTPNY